MGSGEEGRAEMGVGADVLKALEESQMKEPTELFWGWQAKFVSLTEIL